jgi:hypothetical protein
VSIETAECGHYDRFIKKQKIRISLNRAKGLPSVGFFKIDSHEK